MTVRKLICTLIVLIGSLGSWTSAQALSLDGNCSNWKVGTLSGSKGEGQGAKARAICAALGKSGDTITVFDPRNQSCLLCARDDWTPGSSSSQENHTRADAAKTVQVPNVVGLMYRDALAKLKEAGLKGRVGKASSPLTLNPRQKVLDQETTAGARVSRGETVVINFSKEGFKTPLTLSNPNLKKQPPPNILTREQNDKVQMPDKDKPLTFSCDPGIPSLEIIGEKQVDPKRIWPTSRQYRCSYNVNGTRRNITVDYYVEQPLKGPMQGAGIILIMCQQKNKYFTNGKAFSIDVNYKAPLNMPISQQLIEVFGPQAGKALLDFHVSQVMPHAISCSD